MTALPCALASRPLALSPRRHAPCCTRALLQQRCCTRAPPTARNGAGRACFDPHTGIVR